MFWLTLLLSIIAATGLCVSGGLVIGYVLFGDEDYLNTIREMREFFLGVKQDIKYYLRPPKHTLLLMPVDDENSLLAEVLKPDQRTEVGVYR